MRGGWPWLLGHHCREGQQELSNEFSKQSRSRAYVHQHTDIEVGEHDIAHAVHGFSGLVSIMVTDRGLRGSQALIGPIQSMLVDALGKTAHFPPGNIRPG